MEVNVLKNACKELRIWVCNTATWVQRCIKVAVAYPVSEATHATPPYGVLQCCNGTALVASFRAEKSAFDRKALADSQRANICEVA